jgi:hypothetical protein
MTSGDVAPGWPRLLAAGAALWISGRLLVAGNLAYAAWRDGGLTVLDVGDPTRPKLLAHRNLDPPFGGGTHSPLPLPDRNLLVLADEANFANCSQGLRHTWLFDVREPTNPVSFATMPVPSEADYSAKGAISGRIISGKTGRVPSRARASSLPPITTLASECSTSRIRSSRARPGSSYFVGSKRVFNLANPAEMTRNRNFSPPDALPALIAAAQEIEIKGVF